MQNGNHSFILIGQNGPMVKMFWKFRDFFVIGGLDQSKLKQL